MLRVPEAGNLFRDCDEPHTEKCGVSATTDLLASEALEDTSGVGTGHACQALDGCLQPEEFDSPVLHTTVRPNRNWKGKESCSGILT